MPRRTPEYVFAKEYEKIMRLINSNKEDDVIELALPLRKILLDQLVHKANKKYKLNIKYRIIDNIPSLFHGMPVLIHQRSDIYVIYSLSNVLYPSENPFSKDKEVKLREFLKVPLGVIGTDELTVKDVISYEANVEGAAHYGKPISKLHKLIAKNNFIAGNLHFTLLQLRSIAKVTIDALSPLYDVIINEQKK